MSNFSGRINDETWASSRLHARFSPRSFHLRPHDAGLHLFTLILCSNVRH